MLKPLTSLLFGLMAALAATTAQSGEYLANTNLFGGDYLRIADADMNAGLCEQRCEGDARCKSWTLVKDGSQGGVNVCYLKDVVPSRAASNCCDSGIKYVISDRPAAPIDPSRAPRQRSYQQGFDRPGNHLARIEDFHPSPEACESLCTSRTADCRAWVYVRPGVQQDGPVCYLKNAATRPVPNSCCATGLGVPQ